MLGQSGSAGNTFLNNSAVLLEDIDSESPLMCTSVHASCCTEGHELQGKFFYPDGSPVQTQSQASSSSQSFYMTQNEHSISLIQQDGDPPPLGSYRCEVPDGGGSLQSLYIRIGETIFTVCMCMIEYVYINGYIPSGTLNRASASCISLPIFIGVIVGIVVFATIIVTLILISLCVTCKKNRNEKFHATNAGYNLK